jgi:hypothetical protein
MRIRAPLTEDPNDPGRWRVMLPSYSLIREEADGTAIVEVPDDDVPPGFADRPGHGRSQVAGVGDVVHQVTAQDLEEWHSHLDGRYQERRGRFRPFRDPPRPDERKKRARPRDGG